MDRESAEEKDGLRTWDKYEEVKLVHEVKQEVCSTGCAKINWCKQNSW